MLMEKKVFDFKKERSSSKVGGKKKKKKKLFVYMKLKFIFILNI